MMEYIRFLKTSNKGRYDSARHGKPPFKSEEFKRSPKQYRLLLFLLLAYRTER